MPDQPGKGKRETCKNRESRRAGAVNSGAGRLYGPQRAAPCLSIPASV